MNTINQMNFLAKNYRPKCDLCSLLCGIEWYSEKEKEGIIVCENCFENSNNPNFSKENFELTNFYNLFRENNGNN